MYISSKYLCLKETYLSITNKMHTHIFTYSDGSDLLRCINRLSCWEPLQFLQESHLFHLSTVKMVYLQVH